MAGRHPPRPEPETWGSRLGSWAGNVLVTLFLGGLIIGALFVIFTFVAAGHLVSMIKIAVVVVGVPVLIWFIYEKILQRPVD